MNSKAREGRRRFCDDCCDGGSSCDSSWAEWIAWTLEDANYSCRIQAWDFRVGSNFVLDMDNASRQCDRTIAVLSNDYLAGLFTQAEWAAAFVGDPTGRAIAP